jgi:lipopolysaccharide transport system ATP-binding protein
MSEYCISVENLTKKYWLGKSAGATDGLRHRLERSVRGLFSRGGESDYSQAGDTREFLALNDVSFKIKTGEVFGIIGRNGAGKSTLLKILSRIVLPTSGQIHGEGRIASLLEVGTGFHPDLTGRENIFLNGALLGMRHAEIRSKFDEIVAFSEIEQFIDTPVRRYSSGMYVRLAFSVAAHLEPEILIIDEVLAVGDAAFQKKCIEKMESAARSGRTILLVSHNMAPIRKLCQRAIVLQKGRVVVDSDPTRKRVFDWQSVEVVDGWMENRGVKTDTFLFGDAPTLVIEVQVHESASYGVELTLRQSDASPIGVAPSVLAQDWEIAGKPGRLRIRAQFPPLQLARGSYALDIALTKIDARSFDRLDSAITFEMAGSALGSRHWDFSQAFGKGALLLDIQFRTEPVA